MEKKIRIKNLDCAHCASELEEALGELEGVKSAQVSFVAQSVTIDAEGEAYEKALDLISHFEEVEIVREVEQIIRLKNLDCAACAAELEQIVSKIDGVSSVSVSFVDQKITLVATEEGYQRAVDAANDFEEVEVVTGDVPKKKFNLLEGHKKELILLIVGAAFFLAGLILALADGEWEYALTNLSATDIVSIVLLGVSYVVVGHPVIVKFVKSFRSIRGFFDENTLMTIASVGAFCLGEFTEGAAVMLLYQLGEFLQTIAVGSSRKSIADLMDLKSDFATLLTEEGQKIVTPEQLVAGDRVLVKAGEKIPADGVVVSGASELDLKSLNGEPVPKAVKEGDEVLSGSINVGGVLEISILRPYADSAVSKILDLVENSAARKAKPERFITRFARIYTPCIFAIALAVGLIIPSVLMLAGGEVGFADWIIRALKVLVISCPCALIISVPLSYFGGIGTCARYGILVKGSTHLDTLAKVAIAAFDKTGTLTEGRFEVTRVEGDERTLPLAAATEANSDHPIAKSLRSATPYKAEEAKEIPGKGMTAVIEGKTVLVGNGALMEENGIAYPAIESESTILYVAWDQTYLGCIFLDDKIKPEAREAIAALKKLGVSETVMLTGDRRARAKLVADAIGIDCVEAELLPDQKLAVAEGLKGKGTLLYAGDGINDAPVMTSADCAVSMGSLGSDAAIEASDVVLVSDALSSIPKAVKIAKRTRIIVVTNIVFSIAVKALFLVLGLWDLIPLWLAVFGDVGVMLIAVDNSLLTRLNVR
ncbi:MAG: heavy metal translocating P-type ATPase [Christensenellaceae bacterium]